MKSTENLESVPLPEILIFPNRLLSAETTEKLLNRVYDVPHVRQVNISGEGLPAKVLMGPATGQTVNHPERQVINVKGREIQLCLQVGRVFVEIDDIDHVEEALDEIEKICNEMLTFGFFLEIGRYSKVRPTTTDLKKSSVKR